MIEVLLHTLIDWMRTEEEEGGREINHHGKSITVGEKQDMATELLVDTVLELLTLLEPAFFGSLINCTHTHESNRIKLKILLPYLHVLSLNFFTGAQHESWTKQPDETTLHWKDEQG